MLSQPAASHALRTCVACWLLTGAAASQPAPTRVADVEWLAPPDCGDRQGLLEELRLALGERDLPGFVRIQIRPLAEGFELELTLFADAARAQALHERRLRATKCEDLRGAAVSLLVVSARAEGARGAGEPPATDPARAPLRNAQPSAGTPPAGAVRRTQPPSPAPDRDAAPGFALELSSFDVGLGLAAESGYIADLAPRLELGLRVGGLVTPHGNVSLGLSGSWVPTVSHELDAERRGELTRSSVAAGLVWESPRFAGDRAQALFGAFVQQSRVTGRGYGVSEPATRSVWSTSWVARGELSLVLDPVRIAPFFELGVAQSDARYVLEGVGLVYAPARFAPAVGLSSWVRFP